VKGPAGKAGTDAKTRLRSFTAPSGKSCKETGWLARWAGGL